MKIILLSFYMKMEDKTKNEVQFICQTEDLTYELD